MNISGKNHLRTFLFSTGGLVAVLIILTALNALIGLIKLRLDFTEEKLHTLSDGTREVLKKLDTPVTIRFYASRSTPEFPTPLRVFADRVGDLLDEYRRASNGKVEVIKIDPKPDSDAADSARLDGIQAQPLPSGVPVYLGISVGFLDKKSTIPAVGPERERLLEYDITRAISEVIAEKKPVVGIMGALPINGSPGGMNPMMGGGQRPWIIANELRRQFEVRDVPMTVENIPADVDLLLVAHPVGISEQTEFAIDQFLLRGGKLIAFLDPLSFHTTLQQQQNPMAMMMGMQAPQPSNLPRLLAAWGLSFDTDKVVADSRYRTQINRGRGPEDLLAVLSLDRDATNNDDTVTAQIESLLLPMPGSFTGKPSEGLKMDLLIESSTESQLVETFRAQVSSEVLKNNFAPSGEKKLLALRLSGKFKTAFPNGKPEASSENENSDAPKAAQQSSAESLKESQRETSVILFADSDILADQFCVQVRDFLGQQLVIPFNENLDMVLNSIEQLAGDAELIKVRSRGAASRPFKVVADMQSKAEARFRSRIAELESELSTASARLSELQASKEPGQKFILSPEQQLEIQRFQRKEAEVRRELKEVRRQLRQDIDALQNNLKFMNIALMPFLVVVAGISVAIYRKKKTAAV